ncbi:MAG: lipid IV(A) 3-deoxy-D-manno-octulosonic acid transferase [Gammaproteobacteria bacterium]|nr:lipid IV(A) 3-deoxy-D-manno-octulosonic acid transferase [Gammaproteobacteria bacterium]
MMMRLYTLLLRLLVPFITLRLYWRGFRNRGYWQRIPERFGRIPPIRALRVLWLHAVSVGEARAAAPLIKALAARYPEHRVLVTTMTPTGSEQVQALFGDDVAHCYVPYDLPGAVRRFLDQARPDIAIMMETELWPNIFRECRARSIPIVVANMRISESAFQRYLKVQRMTAATLAQAAVLAAQSQADADRLQQLGAPAASIHVTGSIKFDVNLSASLREAAELLRGEWGRIRPVWLAASTHEGEEELILQARAQLNARFPNQLLVLVPRHPERFGAVARLAKRQGCRVALRSERTMIDSSVDVLIGDTMGELQLFYGAVDVAYVGGSLVPTGGHNVLEAAAVGTPTVFGPHMFNFVDIARLTLERGAGTQVANVEQLAPALADFLGNANRRFEAGEAGKRLIEENRGALARTLKLIETLLPPANSREITT